MYSARENIDCSYGDFAIPCCRLYRVLRVISADFQSETLVMLLLQVLTLKTDRKAKYTLNAGRKWTLLLGHLSRHAGVLKTKTPKDP